MHVEVNAAVVAEIVESCDVVASGLRKIQYLRNRRILAADEAAIDHPVHFCIRASDFEASFGHFFARRTSYHRAVIQTSDGDPIAGTTAGAVCGPGRGQRVSAQTRLEPWFQLGSPTGSFDAFHGTARTFRGNTEMRHSIDE